MSCPSRPAAVDSDWLDSDTFVVTELQTMTPRDVRTFIQRWHEAMRSQSAEQEQRAALDVHEQQLLDSLASHRALRRIAETPLLCSLLCALSRDRRGEIPHDRMALHKTALEMLLGRRDEERGLKPLPGLFQNEQLLLLQEIAYWLVRNEKSSADIESVRERIAARLNSLGRVAASPDEVLSFC